MDALVTKHGLEQAKQVYARPCPLVQASIGQHIRHSMDHLERAVMAAATLDVKVLNYDKRERGGLDEHDWDEAKARIERVDQALQDLVSSASHIPMMLDHQVEAIFMLSGDSELEYCLPSTIAREMGFAAHHAIHHLAMLRIIATKSIGQLNAAELPEDFGRAPSTVNHDRAGS